MPITSDNGYYLYTGSPVKYDNSLTKMWCAGSVDMKANTMIIDVQVWDTAGDVFYGAVPVSFTEAEVEAFTGTGTGDYSTFKSVVEQAVKDYLENVTENSGITFTIV